MKNVVWQREYKFIPEEEEVIASKLNLFYRITYVIEEFQYSFLYIVCDSNCTVGSGWKSILFDTD
jgi:hypothetical protein